MKRRNIITLDDQACGSGLSKHQSLAAAAHRNMPQQTSSNGNASTGLNIGGSRDHRATNPQRPPVPRLSDGGTFTSVSVGTWHQGETVFKNPGTQCTPIAVCAGAYSVIKGRTAFSTADIDSVLIAGDDLYENIKYMLPGSQNHFEPDEIPQNFIVNNNSVEIEPIHDNYIVSKLLPKTNKKDDINAVKLELAKIIYHRILYQKEPNNDDSGRQKEPNDDDTDSFIYKPYDGATDSFVFTGNGYTVGFWCSNDKYYVFNSHAVSNTGIACNQNDMNKARLFECSTLIALAELLILSVNAPTSGPVQYSIFRVRVVSSNLESSSQITFCPSDANSQLVHELTQSTALEYPCSEPLHFTHTTLDSNSELESQSILADISLNCNTPPTSTKTKTTRTHSPLDSNSEMESQSILADLSQNFNTPQTTTKRKITQPQSNVKRLCSDSETVVNEIKDLQFEVLQPEIKSEKKRGRPVKKKRGRKPTKQNAHLDAVKKYNEKKPEINRKAVKKYTENKPEVHRETAQKYQTSKPEVHREAAQKYQTSKPEVNREAVKKYTEKNPEVNREAVKKYTEKNPEVHRDAVRRYDDEHPEINQQSVQIYNETSRNVDTPLRRSRNLIGEKRDEELLAIRPFALKVPNLQAACTCQHCGARIFQEEKSRLQWCCGQGKFNVQNLTPLTEDFYEHPHFLGRPRAYNNAFSFSALGVSEGYCQPDGISFIKIQGRTYHRVFDLSYDKTSNNIRYYVADDVERENMAKGQNLDLQVIRCITNFLYNVNPFIECFRRLNSETSSQAFLKFEKTTRATHGNILGDQPLGREIAAVICTEREEYTPRCIAIWKIGDSKPHTVDIFHPLYESFQFPLLYPNGNSGWYIDKKDNNNNKLTQVKYVRCLLLSEPRFSIYGRLSEEWIVDLYSRICEERLRYLANMQTRNSNNELRQAPLQELTNDETITAEGIVPGRIYLPNTYTGGPRYMKCKYLDCIALVNRLGPPSYFVTFTCNPRWPEIKQNLLHGRAFADPLICARTFNLRLFSLLRDIRSGVWFGKIEYLTYVIEFQKRGLPHAHICFRVEGGGPQNNIDIDKVCRADIPHPSEANGTLRTAVLEHMIHGPCGPPLRENLPCYDREKKKCTKFFPKHDTSVTHIDERGFVNLRRNGNNEGIVKYRGREITVNDCWVVPYNAALLLKYNAHINVEISSQRSVIKYLFKYMTKGPDEARVTVVAENQINEIENYVTKRYISSSEAVWRTLEFDTTYRVPNVKQLCVHLEGNQTVYFKRNNIDEAVGNSGSDLITYFNRPPGEQFDRLTYLEFYEKYIVHAKRPSTKNAQIYELTNVNKFITPRQRGELVARIFMVAPNKGEQFYLRLLLNKFPCRSYTDLMNLGGPDCTTFQDAAKAVGLADDEIEYEEAMREAASYYTGPRLRSFFVLLAVNGAPVASLWDQFKYNLSEDIINRHLNENIEIAYNMCLQAINRLLRKHGTSLVEHGLPDVSDHTTELEREHLEYDRSRLTAYVDEWASQLSDEQRAVYDYVDKLCRDEQFRDTHTCALFIDGPAGTGKTLLLNFIAAHVRGNLNGVVLCTASSAIAALNYEGGITAHSMFKYPLDLVDDRAYWNITNKSQRAELIYKSNVIIYDETPMAHKYLIHLLDRSLRDLMNSDKIFGGKIIIFSGDFRQIPPVVPNARSNSDIVNSSVKSSPLWPKLETFALRTSQRCREDPEYSEFLLKLGSNELVSDRIQTGRTILNLTELNFIEFVTDVEDLIDFVFPFPVIDEPDVCVHRAILCTRNDTVRQINSMILNKVPGDLLHFYSIDKVESEHADALYLGSDALNQMQPQGVPEHDLKLKEGCVCMITRNISFSDGLVNGTKVIVVNTSPRLITVRKSGVSDDYLIPRILFKAPVEPNSPLEMVRRQFPLQVCYAMTIHKSQGQTIGRVGVNLNSDPFSHGQLYVALSRVRERQNIKILIHTDRVSSNNHPMANNVVIPELI